MYPLGNMTIEAKLLAKVTRGNQITIPKEIVKKAHLKEASEYVEVGYADGQIYLKPVVVEEYISPEEYEKFIDWALKREKGDVSFSSMEEAIGYLKKRSKKG